MLRPLWVFSTVCVCVHFLLILGPHCAEVDPRWAHKYVSLAALLGILWHAKDFLKSPEVDSDAVETQLEFM